MFWPGGAGGHGGNTLGGVTSWWMVAYGAERAYEGATHHAPKHPARWPGWSASAPRPVCCRGCPWWATRCVRWPGGCACPFGPAWAGWRWASSCASSSTRPPWLWLIRESWFLGEHCRLRRSRRPPAPAAGASSTCRRWPSGTRPPTCRRRQRGRAAWPWPSWTACCTAWPPTRPLARPDGRCRGRAARRLAACQPARDPPRLALGQCAAREPGVGQDPGQRALRARLAHAAPANDWAGFAPNLREVLALARQEAEACRKAVGSQITTPCSTN